ncbi:MULTISPECIES: 4-hydroxy-tetrahydrodipicolinate synthase [Glutamicibacter]|uniref:4-hydroxy-tetrahydrodipicolinate synthase n=1 Tax=Glutamicibacter ardleyensis TaxID=225894 RepID=A0ABQ2DBG1_9MICC|nr:MULTISPECIES: 4-hydroxy-tetrahydrodipicolinate synthase [Glutamicibacter]PCC36993.1 4-hydroxy-tetrahydrodipicolinate synthase [Glutamicibacter sp. BW77]GGJ52601.1 4-hydroxy-tetrahydrodipicolinate synthase 2 [Glutamicibacter ardleyensis]
MNEQLKYATESFGRVITAMITHFDSTGQVDLVAVRHLAAQLTAPGFNDAVVVNGTTGESISTTEAEKLAIITAAKEAVPGTARVIAGVGAADTASSIRMANDAERAGADGLLVVAPYYSRPTQQGLIKHFESIAERTELPIMLYDIPGRTGVAIEPGTFARLAAHPQIIAVKDAKGDLESSSQVIAETSLAYYSGDDALNLPLLSIGAVGFVSVVGHVVGDSLRQLLEHHDAGQNAQARALHQRLLPIYRGMFRAPAACSVKSALASMGRGASTVRSPMVELDADLAALLRADLVRVDLGAQLQTAAGIR